MGGLVSLLAHLGSNPDVSQKYKIGDIIKGVATLSRKKSFLKWFKPITIWDQLFMTTFSD